MMQFQSQVVRGSGNYLASNNYDVVWYSFKEFMRGVGWSTPQQSDGSVLKQDGTQAITSAAGMSNARSWYVLKEPGVWSGQRREFLFHHNWNLFSAATDAAYMNIMYSVQGFQSGAGWNSGVVSATNIPIAYDGIMVDGFINGGSSDYTLVPSYYQNLTPTQSAWNQFFPTSGNFSGESQDQVVVFCASDTAPYFWYIMGYSASATYDSSATPNFFICYDPLESFESGDQDPVMLHSLSYGGMGADGLGKQFTCLGNNTPYNANITHSCWSKWVFSGSSKATIDAAVAARTSYCSAGGMVMNYAAYDSRQGNVSGNMQIAPSPYGGKRVTKPCTYFYYRSGSNYLKGTSKYLRSAITTMLPFQGMTVSSSGDYLAIPDGTGTDSAKSSARLLVPWSGSLPSF